MTTDLPDPETREAALYKLFAEIGIAWSTIEHAPVFTVEDSGDIYQRLSGCHTKNLFLKDKKGGLWLVVVRAELRVDLNTLAKQLGAPRFSFGSAELLIATLGITPGSVTPFALMNDVDHKVQVVLDADMLTCGPVNYHPLRNDRTTTIAPEDLVRFVEACSHKPIIAPIPQRAD